MSNLPRILIVDDMPANIRVLAEALHPEYRIQVATNGRTALNLIQNREDKPDLILLDVMMPDLDGYETCRILKESEVTRDIPVIFVTAKGETEDVETGLNLGAVDYITKPFHLAIVKARIRNHVHAKRRADLLAAMAHIDSLTGIPNRRCFDDTLERELRRAFRNRGPLSLMVMDIDFFKGYNDHYGHGAGDHCLRQVAQGLSDTLQRAGDGLFRYGGEEFAAILSGTDHAGVLSLAAGVRQRLFDLNIPHCHSPVADRVTISIGCATASPRREDPRDLLFTSADRMLYQAKEQGRNRVCGVDLTLGGPPHEDS